MKSVHTSVLAATVLILGCQLASAQDVSRYRAYVLESSLESVISTSGVRASDVKTLHERPAKIQELEWRTPYAISGREQADPVRDIAFTFYNNALYQVVVSYDRERTKGLTNSEIIESVSATYGAPVLGSAKTGASRAAVTLPDTIVLAHWEDAASSATLLRDAYSPEFQLILVSKATSARARSAIREAIRLDAIDAPRRESEQRKKEAADASAQLDKTRTTNRDAFRP